MSSYPLTTISLSFMPLMCYFASMLAISLDHTPISRRSNVLKFHALVMYMFLGGFFSAYMLLFYLLFPCLSSHRQGLALASLYRDLQFLAVSALAVAAILAMMKIIFVPFRCPNWARGEGGEGQSSNSPAYLLLVADDFNGSGEEGDCFSPSPHHRP